MQSMRSSDQTRTVASMDEVKTRLKSLGCSSSPVTALECPRNFRTQPLVTLHTFTKQRVFKNFFVWVTRNLCLDYRVVCEVPLSDGQQTPTFVFGIVIPSLSTEQVTKSCAVRENAQPVIAIV